MKLPGKSDQEKFNSFIRYSNIGLEMAATIGVATFIGYRIDRWMNNKFLVFTLVLMVLSFIGSLFRVVRNLLKK
jgi:F0F1-type ATP synthase assembly protein I